MSGREEQDLQREEWISRKLADAPEILEDYMISVKSKKKTSATRKAYLGYLLQYIDFMTEMGADYFNVEPRQLDRYINHVSKGNGKEIINAKLAAISDFYNYLLKNHLTTENPCEDVGKLKVDDKEVIYMTDQEVEQIKENAAKGKVKFKNRNICIITLGCATGLRVSAIRNIDIEDIDFDNKSITVIEKGNKKRTVFIGDNTVASIKNWMKDREKIFENNSGPLFMSGKKNRMSVRAIQEMIHNAAMGIDKHITPHKMRSTCAMKLYGKTGDIYLTAQQLGHSNIKNTQKYATATEDRRREAALLLD